MPASSPSSSRPDIRSPARAARRRMRWAALEGQDAGEDVDADVVLGPVVHGREGHDVRVLHLAEGELGLGLGPVPGHDLGNRPVVVAGDQHVLAENLLFEGGAGVRVDAPGKPQVLRLVSGEFPGDDAAGPGFCGDRLDLGGDLLRAGGSCRGPAWRPARRLLPALARVVPSNPRAWDSRSSGEWVGRRGVPRRRPLAPGVIGGQPAEPVLIDGAAGGGGQGGQPGSRWRARTRCSAAPASAKCAKLASLFCPASKTTVMSAARDGTPAAAQTASYRPRSWV